MGRCGGGGETSGRGRGAIVFLVSFRVKTAVVEREDEKVTYPQCLNHV